MDRGLINICVISENKSFIKDLINEIEYNIYCCNLDRYKIKYSASEIDIIIFDDIKLRDIFRIREKNYNTKFIYLYDKFPLDNIYLFTSCRFSSVIEKSKFEIGIFFKELEKVVGEIDKISNSFLLRLQDNYNWQSSSKTLYDKNFKVVEMTKSEQSVFEVLVNNSNNVLSLEMIQDYLEQNLVYIKKRSLQNIISIIRKKISGDIIKNIYGEGYKIDLKFKENRFELQDLQKLSRALDNENDEVKIYKIFCDTLFDMYKPDRSFVMYVDFDENKIKVPYEISNDEYPGAAKLNIEIPLSKLQFDFYKTITKLSDPIILKYKQMKDLLKEFPTNKIWERMELPKSALVFHFKVKERVWMSGLHHCSYERKWTTEEIIFLKHCSIVFEKKMNSI